MTTELQKKFEQIAPALSRTPLLAIRYRYEGREGTVFAKAEYYNLTGSIKDLSLIHS